MIRIFKFYNFYAKNSLEIEISKIAFRIKFFSSNVCCAAIVVKSHTFRVSATAHLTIGRFSLQQRDHVILFNVLVIDCIYLKNISSKSSLNYISKFCSEISL